MKTQVTTQVFKRGISWGRKGIFRGNLCVEQSEEGKLAEELLRQDVGIVVGFVVGHPEVLGLQAEETDALQRQKSLPIGRV